jgi:Acetyltransferase (GNAT) domain
MSNRSNPSLYTLGEVTPTSPIFKGPDQSFFDSFAWYDLLAKTLYPTTALVLDNRLSGEHFSGLVLMATKQKRFGLSISSYDSFSNFYTMSYNYLGSGAPEDLSPLASNLASLGSNVIRLNPIASENGASRQLAEALENNGFAVRTTEAFGNWVEPTSGRSFDQYFSARSSQTINTYRRKRKALEKSHVWKFRMLQSSSENLEQGIEDYLSVYRQSWKQPENFAQFTQELIRLTASHNLLRLGIVEVDGEPAAAQLWIRDGESSIIYKLAHVPKFEGFSVGLILMVEMLKHAFDRDRVALIDFGSGDDAYKSNWMSQRRSRDTLTAFNKRTSLGFLASLKSK